MTAGNLTNAEADKRFVDCLASLGFDMIRLQLS